MPNHLAWNESWGGHRPIKKSFNGKKGTHRFIINNFLLLFDWLFGGGFGTSAAKLLSSPRYKHGFIAAVTEAFAEHRPLHLHRRRPRP